MWVLCRAETILCHHINGVRTLRKIMGKMGVLFALTYKRNNYFPAHVLAEVLRSPSTSNVQRPTSIAIHFQAWHYNDLPGVVMESSLHILE
jgi:hypothetical protein